MDFLMKSIPACLSRSIIHFLSNPPTTFLTIGALSRLFKTSPIDATLYFLSSSSYFLPIYRFLLTIIHGQNTFS